MNCPQFSRFSTQIGFLIYNYLYCSIWSFSLPKKYFYKVKNKNYLKTFSNEPGGLQENIEACMI